MNRFNAVCLPRKFLIVATGTNGRMKKNNRYGSDATTGRNKKPVLKKLKNETLASYIARGRQYTQLVNKN